MMICRAVSAVTCSALVAMSLIACKRTAQEPSADASLSIKPATLTVLGTVDERYQSYNVEMLEVTGGKFWKPYGPEFDAIQRDSRQASTKGEGDTPAGMDSRLYQFRPPIDLANPRLRKLAAALGPAYVRVSGTWANTTYFPESERVPTDAPKGFLGVLTQPQWKGVVEFARATDAKIVTSFTTGEGVRDKGVWTPQQAKRWLDYTRTIGGSIAAAEFMNEPNLAAMGGAPQGYDAQAYGRDFKVFYAFAKSAAPTMLIAGPGSVGESTGAGLDIAGGYGGAPLLNTRALLESSGGGIDVFSYHHYGAVSKRCVAFGANMQTTPDAALSEDWLGRTDQTLAFYRKLRDEFAAGKPMWLTETADTACGGNPWANTFLDTFRYLDQLGRLAKQDVQAVFHNTLAASDYGLLDENTFEPKPNYWGALLWRRLMSATVLDSGIPSQAGLHVYSHCLRDAPGGVAVLLINTDRNAVRTVNISVDGERYTLSSKDLQSSSVRLNDTELELGTNDGLPALTGAPMKAGRLTLEPATITFIGIPQAHNDACS